MSQNPSNISQHELIGLKFSFDDELFGIIIDETKNMFIVEINGKIKRIIKKYSIFKFKINDEMVQIEGKFLNSRPEDRLKKKNKRNW
jgi:ribonuclease P protein subunit POP4